MPKHLAKHRTYTPEQKAEIIAALVAGTTLRAAAEKYNMPLGSVATLKAAANDVKIVESYSEITQARIREAAERNWRTLDVLAEKLGDREFIERHAAEAFGVAGAYRIMAETLGRFLAALPRDD